MIVMSQGQHVGHIDDAQIGYHGGKMLMVRTMELDFEDIYAQGASLKNNTFDDLTMPVNEMIRRVKVGDHEIQNAGGRGLRGFDVAVSFAAKDPAFCTLMNLGAELETHQDPMAQCFIVTARLRVAEPDLETYEKLFDLDVFTPA